MESDVDAVESSTELPGRTDVIVASGWNEIEVLRSAASPFRDRFKPTERIMLTIALGDSSIAKDKQALVDWCLETIGQNFETQEVISPTKLAVAGWVRSSRSRDRWATVDIDDRSDRLEKAWLRREIVEANRLVVINHLSTDNPSEPLVLGLWAKFAHPRQRLGALAGDDRTGLRAELAVAVKPDLVILVGESRERPLIIATQDQLAAELTGRAFQSLLLPDPFGERVGPWELPLIQRATELNIGVRLPKQLAIHPVWAGESGEPGAQMHEAIVDQIRLALGAPAV